MIMLLRIHWILKYFHSTCFKFEFRFNIGSYRSHISNHSVLW